MLVTTRFNSQIDTPAQIKEPGAQDRANPPAMTCRKRRRSALASAVLVLGNAAWADESPSVTPYRPSVSSPAALSAPGWLEIEAGVESSRAADPTRRSTANYTLKYAFTPDWGIRIGGDGLIRETSASGSQQQGFGDTTIVVKRRFALTDKSAWGLELGAKLATARNGLGSGHTDIGATAIYSSDFAEDWHTDLNLTLTRVGGVGVGASRWQKGWAASLSHSLSEQWGVGAELSGARQGGFGGTSQALLAASFAFSRRLSVDFGMSKGLNAASGGRSYFAGFTLLTGRMN